MTAKASQLARRLDTFGHSSTKIQDKCSLVNTITFTQIALGLQAKKLDPQENGKKPQNWPKVS